MEKTYSVEEIKRLASEMTPLLEKVKEFKEGIPGTLMCINAWENGDISVDGLEGWTIRLEKGMVKITYRYEESYVLEGGKA